MKFIIATLSLALCTASWAQTKPNLESPRGGWQAIDDGNNFVQEVNYPASRVNLRSGASLGAQIRGQIAGATKTQPATLIINGVPMPLETDEAGHFERPYAFAAGSNSLEVRSNDARSSRRVQFLDVGTGHARPRLRILLSWDSPGTDLDLHVITPSGEHCFYGNRIIASGGALDVDVTTGYGPEIFATPRPERGVWHVYVNYYGGGGRNLTTAQVAVINAEGTPSETQRIYRVPLRASGDLQHVASFSVL